MKLLGFPKQKRSEYSVVNM